MGTRKISDQDKTKGRNWTAKLIGARWGFFTDCGRRLHFTPVEWYMQTSERRFIQLDGRLILCREAVYEGREVLVHWRVQDRQLIGMRPVRVWW